MWPTRPAITPRQNMFIRVWLNRCITRNPLLSCRTIGTVVIVITGCNPDFKAATQPITTGVMMAGVTGGQDVELKSSYSLVMVIR